MPTFRVTSPDGRTFRVTAPDGATADDALAYVQQQHAPTAKPTQVDDPGVLESALIGAGKTFTDLGRGVKQAYYGITNNTQAQDELKATVDEEKKIYSKLAQQHPIATTLGEALPLMAGIPAVSSVTGAAALSAIPGLVSYGSPEEKAKSAALGAAGGAVGAGVGKLIGRGLNPIRSMPDPVAESAAGAAQRLGYTPTAGQQSGNRFLQMMEQQAAKNPLSARQAQAFNQENQRALNTAAARAMGETGDQLSEDAFAAARSRIGAEFDRLSQGKEIPLDSSFTARINAMRSRVEQAGPFKNTQASNVLDAADAVAGAGKVSGEAYQAIRSELSDMARAASRAGNDKLASSIKGVRNAFDSAAEKALSPDDLKAWQRARSQYGAMKTLEKRGAVKAGDVDPAIIRNALQSADRGAFARGTMTGELPDIARIGNAFRPLPDSGTASNWLAQMMLTGGAGMIGPGALATTLLAPVAASKLLFSPAGRKYLTEGAVKVTPELEKKLMRGGFGLLGTPAIALNQ